MHLHGIRKVVSFCEAFQCISSMSSYLDEAIFSGSLLFSRVALLNWFTKSSKFEEGFNNNELSWSFSRSFHCVMLLSVLVQQARKFLLLDKELKGKIVLQNSMQYHDSSQFWRFFMKKLFSRSNSPCMTYLFLFFAGRTNIQKF